MAGGSAILSIRIVANARDLARGLRQSQRDVRRFVRDIDTLSGGLSGLAISGVSTFAKIGAGAFAATSAVAPLIGVVGSLALGMAGMATVGLPALAAIGLGLDGIKAAAKTITPQFDKIKAAVSSTFERALTPAFEKLGNLLDSITPAMQGVAEAVSGAFSGMVDVITGPGRAALDSLLAGGKKFVEAMTPGLEGLTLGFLKFGENAAGAAGQMGTAFGGVLQKLGDALGKIPTSLFDGFAKALDGIGNLLGPVVTLFSELGIVLGPIVGTLATQLGEALTSITPQLALMGGIVGQAVVDIFTQLAPVLPSVATAFANMLIAVAPLVPVVADFVARGLLGISNWINENPDVLKDFVNTMVRLVEATAPYAPQIIIIVGLLALVAAAMGGSIPAAIGLALGAFIVLFNFFKGFTEQMVIGLTLVIGKVIALKNDIAGALTSAITTVQGVFATLKGVGEGAFDRIKSAVSGVASAIGSVIGAVGRLISALASIRFPSAPGWLSAVFSAPGDGGPTFMPPDVTRFFPAGYETFAAAPPDLTAASVGFSGSGRVDFGHGRSMNITNVSVTVEGAIDPVAVGGQIVDLLKKHGITVGTTPSGRY